MALALGLLTGGLLWLRLPHAALTQVVLVLHLVTSAMALLLFVPYAVFHLRDGREPWIRLVWPFALLAELQWDRYARKRLHGHALLWALTLTLLSGALIALPGVLHLGGRPDWIYPYGLAHTLLQIHQASALSGLVLLLLHIPAQTRR